MPKVSIIDIETAFDFVNFDSSFSDNNAVVNRETGEIFYLGDAVDEELPEDFDEEDDALAWIPGKHDLGLDSRVAKDFAHEFCPEEIDEVNFIFSNRGAYAHFKRLLERKGLLDKWYKIEEERTRAALIDWCNANKIELEK